MTCFSNAKINLGLNVVSKRPDDYHNIETIFYPIPVRDVPEIIVSDRTCFAQTRILIDTPQEKDPVIKTLNALKTRYEIPPLEIHLLKAIPSGVGLGGGSTDAAFVLKLVNDFCGLDIYLDKLGAITSAIGADYPFFVRNTPVFAIGTGNRFGSMDLPLKDHCLHLVKPDVAVSTPEACLMATPAAPETSLKEIIRLPVSEWKERMVDDLERSVFPRRPVIGRIKDILYEGSALYAAMSGSGSFVFGLFEKPTHFKEQSLFSDCFLWKGRLP